MTYCLWNLNLIKMNEIIVIPSDDETMSDK